MATIFNDLKERAERVKSALAFNELWTAIEQEGALTPEERGELQELVADRFRQARAALQEDWQTATGPVLATAEDGRMEHRFNAEVSEGGTRDSRIETAAQSRPSLH